MSGTTVSGITIDVSSGTLKTLTANLQQVGKASVANAAKMQAFSRAVKMAAKAQQEARAAFAAAGRELEVMAKKARAVQTDNLFKGLVAGAKAAEEASRKLRAQQTDNLFRGIGDAVKAAAEQKKKFALEAKKVEEQTKSLADAFGLGNNKVEQLGSAFGVSASAALGIGIAVAAVAAIVIGTGAAVYTFVETMDAWATSAAATDKAMLQLSDRTGAAVEFVSGVGFAAAKAGISQDQFANALQTLTEKVSSAPQEFKKWGISITDANGYLLRSDVIMKNVAKRMAESKSASERAAIGMDTIGKQGKAMNAFLVQASNEGFDQVIAKADKLGAVTTEATGAMATAFLAAKTDMDTAFHEISETIGEEFQPVLTSAFQTVTKYLVKFIEYLNDHKADIEQFARDAMRVLARVATFMLEWAEKVILPFEAMGYAVEGILAPLKLLGADVPRVGKHITTFRNAIDTAGDAIETWADGLDFAAKGTEAEKKATDESTGSKLRLTDAMKKLIEERKKLIALTDTAAQSALAESNTNLGATTEPKLLADIEASYRTSKAKLEDLITTYAKLRSSGTNVSSKRLQEIQSEIEATTKATETHRKEYDQGASAWKAEKKTWDGKIEKYAQDREQYDKELEAKKKADRALIKDQAERDKKASDERKKRREEEAAEYKAIFGGIFGNIAEAGGQAFAGIGQKVDGVVKTMSAAWGQFFAMLAGKLADKALNGLFDMLFSGPGDKGGAAGGAVGAAAGGIGKVLGFAEGGRVPGTDKGRDSVLATLRPGEHVLTVDQVRALNAGGVPGFAKGGLVGQAANMKVDWAGEAVQAGTQFASGNWVGAAVTAAKAVGTGITSAIAGPMMAKRALNEARKTIGQYATAPRFMPAFEAAQKAGRLKKGDDEVATATRIAILEENLGLASVDDGYFANKRESTLSPEDRDIKFKRMIDLMDRAKAVDEAARHDVEPTIDMFFKRAKKMAAGGIVKGGIPGRDSVPTMLMPGERVQTKREVDREQSGLSSEKNKPRVTMSEAPTIHINATMFGRSAADFDRLNRDVIAPSSRRLQRYAHKGKLQ